MFNFTYFKQAEGWEPNKAVIVTQTSPFIKQQEHAGMISPKEIINATNRAWHLDAKDLIKGIKNKESY